MTVKEFENKVWRIEGVRVVVRAAASAAVQDYGYRNAADKTWNLSEWLENRVVSKLNGYDVVVIGADGKVPHGRTLLRTIRERYA